MGGQHIGIVGEQFGIIQPQMLPHDWGNLFLHLDSIIAFVPARRGGVAFGEHLAVFQIGNDILLFDFVAAVLYWYCTIILDNSASRISILSTV